MTFATFEVQVDNKKFKINLKARYTQKGSIVIATGKGDILDLLPDGSIEFIATPSGQYAKKIT